MQRRSSQLKAQITKSRKARLEVFRPARIRTLTCAPGGGGGGGVHLGIIGGGVPPGSQNPDPISNQKCHFPDPFSDLAFRQKLC